MGMLSSFGGMAGGIQTGRPKLGRPAAGQVTRGALVATGGVPAGSDAAWGARGQRNFFLPVAELQPSVHFRPTLDFRSTILALYQKLSTVYRAAQEIPSWA